VEQARAATAGARVESAEQREARLAAEKLAADLLAAHVARARFLCRALSSPVEPKVLEPLTTYAAGLVGHEYRSFNISAIVPKDKPELLNGVTPAGRLVLALLSTVADTVPTRAFGPALLTSADTYQVERRRAAVGYLTLLEHVGYTLTDVEADLLTKAKALDEPVADEAAAS
ncbi:MAG: hypothetical protein ACLGHM_09695, partial [Actinomycetes bacterium]